MFCARLIDLIDFFYWDQANNFTVSMLRNWPVSNRSGTWVWGGKDEICVTASGHHLFMTYFYRTGGMVLLSPWICFCQLLLIYVCLWPKIRYQHSTGIKHIKYTNMCLILTSNGTSWKRGHTQALIKLTFDQIFLQIGGLEGGSPIKLRHYSVHCVSSTQVQMANRTFRREVGL